MRKNERKAKDRPERGLSRKNKIRELYIESSYFARRKKRGLIIN